MQQSMAFGHQKLNKLFYLATSVQREYEYDISYHAQTINMIFKIYNYEKKWLDKKKLFQRNENLLYVSEH